MRSLTEGRGSLWDLSAFSILDEWANEERPHSLSQAERWRASRLLLGKPQRREGGQKCSFLPSVAERGLEGALFDQGPSASPGKVHSLHG